MSNFVNDMLHRETILKILKKASEKLGLKERKEVDHLEYLFKQKMPKNIKDMEEIVNWLVDNFSKVPMKDKYFVQESKISKLLKLIGR